MPMAGDYLRRGTAEFVGTFALVFVAAGSLIYGNIVGTALAYGFVVAAMTWAVGSASGGHFNPAVTFGFVITRRISLPLAVTYWLTQLVAAIAAAALLKWVLPAAATDAIKLGAPEMNQDTAAGKGVVIEAVITFFLMWVISSAAADVRATARQVSAFATGLTITAGVLVAGLLTGAVMNPARAFGPELIGNHWADWWVWYLGPLAGAAVAAVVYELLYLRPARPAVAPVEHRPVEPAPPGDVPPA